MDLRPDLYQHPKLITIFGGSGFVGRHVVEALTKRGYRVRVAVRRPEQAYYMLQIGEVGQTQMLKTNVRIRESVARALIDADAAIFLPGVMFNAGKNNFDNVQLAGAKNVAELAQSAGIPLIHLSALTGNAPQSLDYVRTKYEGEKAVREAHRDAIILRPSVIFGPEDNFFNKFADMARFSPFLPIFGGGMNKMQPVYVGDVAEMIARSIDGQIETGKTYELGGPEVMTFRQIMQEALHVIRRKRLLLSIPYSLGILMGGVFGLLAKIPLMPKIATADQIKMLKFDNIVSSEAIAEGRTLEGVGIKPRAIEAILTSYLWRYRIHGQFSKVTAR
ncbi:complex I NDUFA9 subunit family protein [Bartonella sp. HY038]|uniref:complex I NDUFA9 subunit family protein n=1 Tax=Bartonella sp. HY038 TaxID=2759660 RepID=UPI0015FC7DE6|nr:complex I NDUFA9 subunit family protein [Bartonella sp. HY038]